MSTGTFQKVYEIVCSIPRGKVLTYGLISNLMDGRLTAQGVGWALKALPPERRATKGASQRAGSNYTSKTVPWQRVISAKGTISTHKIGDIPAGLQRRLLEDEGIVFREDDTIDLDTYLWKEGLLLD